MNSTATKVEAQVNSDLTLDAKGSSFYARSSLLGFSVSDGSLPSPSSEGAIKGTLFRITTL